MRKWDERFLILAKQISTWSSCYKDDRQVGAVIARGNKILTTGYNGSPCGVQSCKEKKECMRNKLGIKSGTQQEKCYAVHAEQNAIIQAAKETISIDGATLYCTHQPCAICAKMIINSGIKRIVYTVGYPDSFALELINQAGIIIEQCKI